MGWFMFAVIAVIAVGGGFVVSMLGYRLQESASSLRRSSSSPASRR